MPKNEISWMYYDLVDEGPFCTRAAQAAIPHTFRAQRAQQLADSLPALPENHDTEVLRQVVHKLQQQGAQAYIVGGYVRDALLGIPSKDIDVEIFGMESEQLKELLSTFGTVDCIGESFGVFLIHGVNIDWSLPRRDSKIGRGHRGFSVECDPQLSIEAAVQRRDLSINAIMADPLSGEIIDPCNGLDDLRQGILRAVDAKLFGDDPLRGLRAVRFAAVYGFQPNAELLQLMSQQNLSELSSERLWGEWEKIALKSRLPSLAFKALDDSGLIRYFPQMAALRETLQEAEWHPEGDVYTHTAMVCDRAVLLRNGDHEHDLLLMLSALCHDFGKPLSTAFTDGRWRSPGHEHSGIEPSEDFLALIHSPLKIRKQVCALVRDHLKPFAFAQSPTGPAAYRRLARKLDQDDLSVQLLADLSEADYRGRTLSDVNNEHIDAIEQFRNSCEEHGVDQQAPQPIVLGRHLLTRGFTPGKELGIVLRKCFDYQLESGESDIENIISACLP
ncbi:MAG: nucleotidyltransferase [Planctomycetes bacterium]|nr:nucleotidyltransferase [Planctomycetota bacterium]